MNDTPKTNKPLGKLIMILALVLVAVILVIVIVATSGTDNDTTPESTAESTPADTTTEAVETTTEAVDTTADPDETSTVETTTVAEPDLTPIEPTLSETPLKADESGKVTLNSADAASGVLIEISAEHPYTYDLENIFRGDASTSSEDIEKSDYKRLVSASELVVTPGWTHYVRKETYNALVSMISTFGKHSATNRVLQVSGYTAAMSESYTSPYITGNVISILGYSGGTLGLNYSLNRVTVDGKSVTYDKWFEAYAASFGFVYEGLVGDDVNLQSGRFRYVGTVHAAGVTEAGSLAAYLDGIKNGSITTATAADGSTWALSYVAASNEAVTEVTVGANATYTVSGDNMGGFVLAVLVEAPAAE